MSYYVFVDNSNVWIEGKYASSVKNGWALDTIMAHENKICDNSWKIDFGRLLDFASDGDSKKIKKAFIFGSKPTDKDSLWQSMEYAGFKVIPIPRNASNKEKKVDTGIGALIDKTLYKETKPGDVLILVLGDADYVPYIKNIHDEKCKAKVVFWDNVSTELAKKADCYVNLTEHIDEISYIERNEGEEQQ
ncbi:MAG: NYN domain-containing protein [Oscillospiraceae bacterium]|jgi:uncharacterized LabA/DUF88 family protein|nr:NYN domain-containing protein [Oscillospiraceae bacterium]MCI2190703.1 NYN domain-containing protein [Oscillospiraceae bacterium]MCI2205382.1 NYN domain-containing protein [Oscillospiraceae bacterium]